MEFAGTPRAGKTTALRGLAECLRAQGRTVAVVDEEASACPVRSKRDPLFNLWTVSRTIQRVVEVLQQDADVALVDRGVLDALCWMSWFHQSGHLSARHHRAIEQFLRDGPAAGMIGLVVLMTVDPGVAIAREPAHRPYGRSGSIMNPETLAAVNGAIAGVSQRVGREFTLAGLDTTTHSRHQTLTAVQDIVLTHVAQTSAAAPASLLVGPAITTRPLA